MSRDAAQLAYCSGHRTAIDHVYLGGEYTGRRGVAGGGSARVPRTQREQPLPQWPPAKRDIHHRYDSFARILTLATQMDFVSASFEWCCGQFCLPGNLQHESQMLTRLVF